VVFTHHTGGALTAAADLVNTDSGDGDRLRDLQALDAFVERHGYPGVRAHDEAELAAVRSLRPRFRRLWALPPDELVAEVNDMFQAARALPQLVEHDGWGYHLHLTVPEAPLADRILVEVAMAVTDVVRAEALDRMRVCAAEDCRDVLVDLSKNRSRRYCSAACSNRVNVAAYRARQRVDEVEGTPAASEQHGHAHADLPEAHA